VEWPQAKSDESRRPGQICTDLTGSRSSDLQSDRTMAYRAWAHEELAAAEETVRRARRAQQQRRLADQPLGSTLLANVYDGVSHSCAVAHWPQPAALLLGEEQSESVHIGCFDAVDARAHISALLTVAARLEESVVQSVANIATVRIVWRCFSAWRLMAVRARLGGTERAFEFRQRRGEHALRRRQAACAFDVWMDAKSRARAVHTKRKTSST